MVVRFGLNAHLLLAALLLAPFASWASIDVSEWDIGTRQYQVNVNPRAEYAQPIGIFSVGDQMEITVALSNAIYKDVTAYITDEVNYNLYRQGITFQSVSAIRRKTPFTLTAQAWSGGQYFLILDNQYAGVITKHARVQMAYKAHLSDEIRNVLRRTMEDFYAELKRTFIFPDFNVRIRPCGQANAFSSPDITLCTELLAQLAGRQQMGALAAVIMHEVGHSLLNVWGLPNFDNEDTADEFAAVQLVPSQKGQEALAQMLLWFSQSNSRQEVDYMLQSGDRHSLSVQRIRNVQRIVKNPAPVIARWNRLLYPHMTADTLEAITKNPEQFSDASLAEQELKSRATGSNAAAVMAVDSDHAQWNKPFMLSGSIHSGTYVDCCQEGKEMAKKYKFLRLDQMLKISGGGGGEGDDPDLDGVQTIQLDMGFDPALYRAKENDRVTIHCDAMYFGATGHYALPVYCHQSRILKKRK